ncbi:unnamed protein product [Fraxinus pennsylvanica]|uniref:Uncharacterized protein n=1 Tax=Fraxinus pennsylvanica TaxID=56036 RepID=A0AAD2DXZ8_9LAMI|nr:unnamed protein product [Fraxinus pennsylvanica]
MVQHDKKLHIGCNLCKILITASSKAAITIEDDSSNSNGINDIRHPTVEGQKCRRFGGQYQEAVRGRGVDVKAGLLVSVYRFMDDSGIIWDGNYGGFYALE